MALDYEIYSDIGSRTGTIYIGNLFACEENIARKAHHVLVQASGDELDWIKATFTNIPMHNGRVVMWTGEMAKFILFHLNNVGVMKFK